MLRRVIKLQLFYASFLSVGMFTLSISVEAGQPITYFKITGDGDSGLSTAKTYTHAINPSGGNEIVNGIPFTGAAAGNVSTLVSKTYTQPGVGTVTINNSIATSNFGGSAIGTNLNGWSGVTGEMLNLYGHFNFNTAPLRTVVLTGLQPSRQYEVRLYQKQYDTSVGRTFSVAFDVGNDGSVEATSPTIDQNHPESTPALSAIGIDQQNAWAMSYVYVTGAAQTSISLAITNSTSATYHFYAVSNELKPEAPVAIPQTLNLTEQSSATNAPIVLTSTLFGSPYTAGTFNIISQPTIGTISPTGGVPGKTYTFVPYANGTTSFAYTVTDPISGLTSAPATVTINIAPVDSGLPVAVNDTATTSDGVPVSVSVLANDTILDGPSIVSIVAQPANGMAVLNPNNTITYTGNSGFAGTDVVTYRVADLDGSTATATLTVTVIPIPPVITSLLSATTIKSLLFTYKIATTGTQPMVYTASPLPPGTTLVGDTISGFVEAGSYLVTLTATNQSGTDTKQLVISSILLAPNADTDGDGYPDELEEGVGSNPVDPNSTPLTVLKNAAGGLPAGAPNGFPAQTEPFFISKTGVGIRLNFSSQGANRDSITLNGTLPVPQGFSAQLQPLVIMVGGATFSGVLDLNSSFANTDRSVRMKIAKIRPALSGGNVPVNLKAKGVYSSFLADEGLSNADVASTPRIPVFVLVGARYYKVMADVSYKARLNKFGTAKSILGQ